MLTSTVLLWLLTVIMVFGQPCQPYKMSSLCHRHHLKKFIRECERKEFLSTDKGIFLLQIYQDSLGQTNWWVKVENENTYSQRAPIGWLKTANQIILVYQQPGWGGNQPTAENLSCLDELVGSRVDKVFPLRLQPLVDRQGRPILDKEGKPVMGVTPRDIVGGGPGNSTHFIFKRNGHVEALKGV
jgi:hypothetical protein